MADLFQAVRFRIKGTGVYVEPVRPAASGAAYDTAGGGRRSLAWRAPGYGPNAALDYAAGRLRDQSREQTRKNAWAAAMVERIVANTVGTGITPQLGSGPAKALWQRWVDEADAAGQLDFYGLQALVMRGVVEAGEVFVRLRARRPEDGLSVPLQLQVLEAEFVPMEKNEQLTGGHIRQGIEFDALGRRVAYWMHRRHPADGSPELADATPVRVPASEVLHVYLPLRPGQLRGEPWLVRALAKLKELDVYDDAALVKKKVAALFAGFIKRPVPEGMAEEDLVKAWGSSASVADGVGGIALEPGTLQMLDIGEDIVFPTTPPETDYEPFMRQQLRAVAAAVGLLYEQLTGDYEKVNDRLWRAAFNEFRRRCEMWQHHLLVFQFCRPALARWEQLAKVAGALAATTDLAGTAWNPAAWPYINPVQDVQARRDEIRAGLASRRRSVGERGEDVEQIDRETAEDQARTDTLGVVYDSDARRSAGSGGGGRTAFAAPERDGSGAPPQQDQDQEAA